MTVDEAVVGVSRRVKYNAFRNASSALRKPTQLTTYKRIHSAAAAPAHLVKHKILILASIYKQHNARMLPKRRTTLPIHTCADMHKHAKTHMHSNTTRWVLTQAKGEIRRHTHLDTAYP